MRRRNKAEEIHDRPNLAHQQNERRRTASIQDIQQPSSIIPRVTWNLTQERIDERTRSKTYISPYSGKLTCGFCLVDYHEISWNHKYYGTHQKRWVCPNRFKNGNQNEPYKAVESDLGEMIDGGEEVVEQPAETSWDEDLDALEQSVNEYKQVKAEMQRLGFTDYDEYLDYL